ncbi:arginase family protein [Rhizobium sp. AG855]|nr:arginase family protein [Rhizobium sp. AG855]RKE77396.1 arginase family protein [Rhizobium sp. AG855]
MNLLLLHLDDALELQPDFRSAAEKSGAREMSEKVLGQTIRLWSRRGPLDSLKRRLACHAPTPPWHPRLCFMGSGDFHHVSALLIQEAADAIAKPLTVVHIDNHPDWVHFRDGIHCGSWVGSALTHWNVHKVITLGVCSDDLRSPERKGANLGLLSSGRLEVFPYEHAPSAVRQHYGEGASYRQRGKHLNWVQMRDFSEEMFIERLLSRIATNAVYITIDKDVLCAEDAATNWDQGRLQLATVLRLIREVGRRHQVAGADVIGDYSRPRYRGSLATQALKRGEILIDQPWVGPDPKRASAINASTNLSLMHVLMEVMG